MWKRGLIVYYTRLVSNLNIGNNNNNHFKNNEEEENKKKQDEEKMKKKKEEKDNAVFTLYSTFSRVYWHKGLLAYSSLRLAQVYIYFLEEILMYFVLLK